MYEREGGDASVATAIEEHYKPQGPSDAVPTDPVAIAVALADKLDTLVGFWAIDEKPTGSKDPFALRRAALGVVRIILENDVRLNVVASTIIHFVNQVAKDIKVTEAIDKSRAIREAVGKGAFSSEDARKLFVNNYHKFSEQMVELRESGYNESYSLIHEVLSFILDRLKVYLRDKGLKHDVIDAVIEKNEEDLVSIVNRVNALQSFLETPDGENLLAGYKRAANILKAEAKKGDLPTGEAIRPKDAQGGALFAALKIAKPAILEAVGQEDYSKALTSLANLRKPIDAFFTDTQIISDDSVVKENNLRLLGMISDTSRQIADFEAIQG